MNRPTHSELRLIMLLIVHEFGKQLRLTTLWRKLQRDPILRYRILRRLKEIHQILHEANDDAPGVECCTRKIKMV